MSLSPRFADFWSMRYSAGGHPLTRAVSQRIGAVFAWAGLRAGMPPNAITLLGTALFLASALLFATLPASPAAAVACLVLFQVGYGLDCADGQLARATGRTSVFGAWLDVGCDYLRNVSLGLAVSAWLLRTGTALPLALAAGGAFIAGTVVLLHTVGAIRQAPSAPHLETPGAAGNIRTALTGFLDTATVLLALALLRPWPHLLAAYCVAVGALYGAMATYLATHRLRRPGRQGSAGAQY